MRVHDEKGYSPFALPPECDADAVECLDQYGRPLLVTARPQRTGLLRLFAGVVLRGPKGRTHLCRRPRETFFAGLWSVTACGPVLAGESAEDAVWRMLHAQAYWRGLLRLLNEQPRLRPLITLNEEVSASLFPMVDHGRVRTEFFTARLIHLPPTLLASDGHRQHPDQLWLDAEEFSGFQSMYAEEMAPLWPLLNIPASHPIPM